jgi:hypothetical protein
MGIASAALFLSMVGVAAATPSPNGPGQPGAPGTTCGDQYPNTPGHSVANNTNSAFNGNGQSDQVYAGNPGTASLNNSNSAKAVSQYDAACFQQSVH